MKDFSSLVLQAKAVTIFKNVINDKGISSLVELLQCDKNNRDCFLSLYSDFVSALYEKTDNLTEYINDILQNDENIYVKQSAKSQASPLLKKAVAFLFIIAQITADFHTFLKLFTIIIQ